MSDLNSEQWAEVKRLFTAAADLRPADLPAYLQRECPNPDVRREVASLLDYSDAELLAADAAIASAAADLVEEPDPDERLVGTRLGPYRVEAIAGHGGMGAVYRASRDDDEFHQQVAIKLVRAAAESPDSLRRFRQERQILARLAHPNIARLLDGGSTPGGVPYLVMEFINGQPISTWCDEHSLGVRERLRLFLLVCEGMEFAHRDLVVHRDLKPANILVTEDGAPKVLDFGIAKLLDPGAAREATTVTGLQALTPEYASPEQVRGEPVSTAADVYALGLILYELLTGKKAQAMAGRTPEAIAAIVCRTEPPAPASLKPQLAGDLDNIIRKAIRKEPERRYASAGMLGQDIQRHLDALPVTARPDTLGYRSSRFLRRHRAAVAAGALMAACIGGGLALATWLHPRAPRALQVTQLTQTGQVEIGLSILTDGSRVYFTERSLGELSLAQVSVKGGAPQRVPVTPALRTPDVMDISPDRSQLLVADGHERDRDLWVVPAAGGLARKVGDVKARAAAWSPDGQRIVLARGSAFFRINADGTNSHKLLDAPREISSDSLSYSPLGGPGSVRVGFYRLNARVKTLWEMAPDGSGLHPLLRGWTDGTTWPEGDSSGRFFPSGKYFVFRSRRGKASSIWALREDRSWLPRFDWHPVQIYSSPLDFSALAPDPGGQRVFFEAVQQRIEWVRFDAGRRQFVPYLPGIAGRSITYSPDGRWVAYTSFPDSALWRCRPDGSERVQLTAAPLRVFLPRWSPDGQRIVITGTLPGENSKAYEIPVHASGAGAPEPVTPAPFSDEDASWSPDGRSLLFQRRLPAGMRGQPGLYVLDRETRKAEFLPGSEPLSEPAWSPDARYIAATNGAQLLLFDFRTRQWTPLATGGSLGQPRWSRDGQYLYYQDVLEGVSQTIFRMRLAGRKIERIATLQQLPQSNVAAFTFSALAPGDLPVATVEHRNADIYALDLDLP